eukprot:PLAT11143.2.p1 GENE.PLAT11143.2~~PLAT11143.2.p1  ORF type:complete len:4641 (+),score=2229.70 PLAT11143.2:24-13946(+)
MGSSTSALTGAFAVEWAAVDETSVLSDKELAKHLCRLSRAGALGTLPEEALPSAFKTVGERSSRLVRTKFGLQPLTMRERHSLQQVWRNTAWGDISQADFVSRCALRSLLLERVRGAVLEKEKQDLKEIARRRERRVDGRNGSMHAAVGFLMTLVKVMSASAPSMSKQLLIGYVPILQQLSPLAMREQGKPLSSGVLSSISSLMAWLSDVMAVKEGASALSADEGALALSGVLSLALSSGSLRVLLAALRFVMLDSDRWAAGVPLLPCLPAMRGLADAQPMANLAPLRTVQRTVALSDDRLLCTGATAMAAGGGFFYIHNRNGLFKLDASGTVVVHNSAFHAGERGSLVVHTGRLYFRSPAIAPAPLLAVDCDTLQEVAAALQPKLDLPVQEEGSFSPLLAGWTGVLCLHAGKLYRLRFARDADDDEPEADRVDAVTGSPLQLQSLLPKYPLAYSNGSRLIALKLPTEDALDDDGDGDICHEWELHSGQRVAEEVSMREAGRLLSSEGSTHVTPAQQCSLSACFDCDSSSIWTYAPHKPAMALVQWRNGRSATPAAATSPLSSARQLDVLEDELPLDGSKPVATTQQLSVWLLAHMDRLSVGVGDNAEEDEIALESAFAVDVHADVLVTLAALLDGALSGTLGARSYYAVYALLRAIRHALIRQDIAGVLPGGSDDGSQLGALGAQLIRAGRWQPDAELADADTVARVRRLAWELLAECLLPLVTGPPAYGLLAEAMADSSELPGLMQLQAGFLLALSDNRNLRLRVMAVNGDGSALVDDSKQLLTRALAMLHEEGCMDEAITFLLALQRGILVHAMLPDEPTALLNGYATALLHACSDELRTGRFAADHSAVRRLLPMFIAALGAMAQHLADEPASELGQMLSVLLPLLTGVEDEALGAAPAAPDEPLTVDDAALDVFTCTVETPHPYDHNMDKEWVFELPDCDFVTYHFGRKSATEADCDYLVVHVPGQADKKYTGSSSNWPKQPVRVKAAKSITFRFHSDGSVNNWGFHATVKAQLCIRLPSTALAPMADLKLSAAAVQGWLLRRVLLNSELGEERAHLPWLRSSVFRSSVALLDESDLDGAAEEAKVDDAAASHDDLRLAITAADSREFVKNLLAARKGSLAAAVSDRMEPLVNAGVLGKMMLGGDAMRSAERAVIACLLMHQGLLSEAVSYGRIVLRRGSSMLREALGHSTLSTPRGRGDAPPYDLERVFKQAAGLRSWFVSQRQKSRKTYAVLCGAVEQRARFLLRLRPLNSDDDHAALVAKADSKWGALRSRVSSLSRTLRRWSQLKERAENEEWDDSDTEQLLLRFMKTDVPIEGLNAVLLARAARAEARAAALLGLADVLQQGGALAEVVLLNALPKPTGLHSWHPLDTLEGAPLPAIDSVLTAFKKLLMATMATGDSAASSHRDAAKLLLYSNWKLADEELLLAAADSDFLRDNHELRVELLHYLAVHWANCVEGTRRVKKKKKDAIAGKEATDKTAAADEEEGEEGRRLATALATMLIDTLRVAIGDDEQPAAAGLSIATLFELLQPTGPVHDALLAYLQQPQQLATLLTCLTIADNAVFTSIIKLLGIVLPSCSRDDVEIAYASAATGWPTGSLLGMLFALAGALQHGVTLPLLAAALGSRCTLLSPPPAELDAADGLSTVATGYSLAACADAVILLLRQLSTHDSWRRAMNAVMQSKLGDVGLLSRALHTNALQEVIAHNGTDVAIVIGMVDALGGRQLQLSVGSHVSHKEHGSGILLTYDPLLWQCDVQFGKQTLAVPHRQLRLVQAVKTMHSGLICPAIMELLLPLMDPLPAERFHDAAGARFFFTLRASLMHILHESQQDDCDSLLLRPTHLSHLSRAACQMEPADAPSNEEAVIFARARSRAMQLLLHSTSSAKLGLPVDDRYFSGGAMLLEKEEKEDGDGVEERKDGPGSLRYVLADETEEAGCAFATSRVAVASGFIASMTVQFTSKEDADVDAASPWALPLVGLFLRATELPTSTSEEGLPLMIAQQAPGIIIAIRWAAAEAKEGEEDAAAGEATASVNIFKDSAVISSMPLPDTPLPSSDALDVGFMYAAGALTVTVGAVAVSMPLKLADSFELSLGTAMVGALAWTGKTTTYAELMAFSVEAVQGEPPALSPMLIRGVSLEGEILVAEEELKRQDEEAEAARPTPIAVRFAGSCGTGESPAAAVNQLAAVDGKPTELLFSATGKEGEDVEDSKVGEAAKAARLLAVGLRISGADLADVSSATITAAGLAGAALLSYPAGATVPWKELRLQCDAWDCSRWEAAAAADIDAGPAGSAVLHFAAAEEGKEETTLTVAEGRQVQAARTVVIVLLATGRAVTLKRVALLGHSKVATVGSIVDVIFSKNQPAGYESASRPLLPQGHQLWLTRDVEAIPHWQGEMLVPSSSKEEDDEDEDVEEEKGEDKDGDMQALPFLLRLSPGEGDALTATLQWLSYGPSAPSRSPLLWDKENTYGPDISIDDDGKLTRTNSSGWGGHCAAGSITSSCSVRWTIQNSGSYMYIGVCNMDFSSWTSSGNHTGMWTLQADKYLYKSGSHVGNLSGDFPDDGDLIMDINMEDRQLVYRTTAGEVVGTIPELPEEVRVCAVFGGSRQYLTISWADGAAATAATPWAGSMAALSGRKRGDKMKLKVSTMLHRTDDMDRSLSGAEVKLDVASGKGVVVLSDGDRLKVRALAPCRPRKRVQQLEVSRQISKLQAGDVALPLGITRAEGGRSSRKKKGLRWKSGGEAWELTEKSTVAHRVSSSGWNSLYAYRPMSDSSPTVFTVVSSDASTHLYVGVVKGDRRSHDDLGRSKPLREGVWCVRLGESAYVDGDEVSVPESRRLRVGGTVTMQILLGSLCVSIDGFEVFRYPMHSSVKLWPFVTQGGEGQKVSLSDRAESHFLLLHRGLAAPLCELIDVDGAHAELEEEAVFVSRFSGAVDDDIALLPFRKPVKPTGMDEKGAGWDIDASRLAAKLVGVPEESKWSSLQSAVAVQPTPPGKAADSSEAKQCSFYFEVSVEELEESDSAELAVGYGLPDFELLGDEPVGNSPGSAALRSDGSVGRVSELNTSSCPPWGSGSTVGCGLLADGSVFFTLDGNLVGEVKASVREGVPTVSSRAPASLQMKCEPPFLFDPETAGPKLLALAAAFSGSSSEAGPASSLYSQDEQVKAVTAPRLWAAEAKLQPSGKCKDGEAHPPHRLLLLRDSDSPLDGQLVRMVDDVMREECAVRPLSAASSSDAVTVKLSTLSQPPLCEAAVLEAAAVEMKLEKEAGAEVDQRLLKAAQADACFYARRVSDRLLRRRGVVVDDAGSLASWGGVEGVLQLLRASYVDAARSMQGTSAWRARPEDMSRMRKMLSTAGEHRLDLEGSLVKEAVRCLGGSERQPGGAAPRVFESPHPYSNNMSLKKSIIVPGATSLRLTFDARCKSEEGCDVLKIFKNGEELQACTGSNWKDVTIPGCEVVLHFKSDGSNVEWGFRVVIEPQGVRSETASLQQPLVSRGLWLADMLLALRGDDAARCVQPLAAALTRYLLAPAKPSERRLAVLSLLTKAGLGHPDAVVAVPEFVRLKDYLLKRMRAASSAKAASALQAERHASAALLSTMLDVSGGPQAPLVRFSDEAAVAGGVALSADRLHVLRPQSGEDCLVAMEWTGSEVQKLRLELKVHVLATASVWLGLVAPSYNAGSGSFSTSDVWSYQADGYFYTSGSGGSGGPKWVPGCTVGMDIDMDESEVHFLFNGVRVKSMGALPKGVQPALLLKNAGTEVHMEIVGAQGASREMGEVHEVGRAHRALAAFSRVGPMSALPDWLRDTAADVLTDGVPLLPVATVHDEQGMTLLRSGIVDTLPSSFTPTAGLPGPSRLQLSGNGIVKWNGSGGDEAKDAGGEEGKADGGWMPHAVGLPQLQLTSGKWYFEVQVAVAGKPAGAVALGWAASSFRASRLGDAHSWAWLSSGSKLHRATARWGAGRSIEQGNVIGTLLDIDAGEVRFCVDGDWLEGDGRAFSKLPAGESFFPVLQLQGKLTVVVAVGGTKLRLPGGVVEQRDERKEDGKEESKEEGKLSESKDGADDGMLRVCSVASALSATLQAEEGAIMELNSERRWTPKMDHALVAVLSGGGAGVAALRKLALPRPWRAEWSSCLPVLGGVSTGALMARAALLLVLNRLVGSVLPLVDWNVHMRSPIAAALVRGRQLLLPSTTRTFTTRLLAIGAVSKTLRVDLYRLPALEASEKENTKEAEVAPTLFAQVHRQLGDAGAELLRTHNRAFTVNFKGEGSQDAGGPYHEALSQIATELQSPALPLLIRTPNGRAAHGEQQGCWLPNPSAGAGWQLALLERLGQLMGIAVRSSGPLDLRLSPMVWKLLVGESVGLADLRGFDEATAKSLDILRNAAALGLSEETFSDVVVEVFTTTTADGRVVELLPGGARREVTWESRDEFCKLLLQRRLHEFDAQIAALRRGLASIVPAPLLVMYSAHTLERLVCGFSTIDVSLLRSTTVYDGAMTEGHPSVLLLWQVLETDFSQQELSKFLRFVSGRNRLPVTRQELERQNCHLTIGPLSTDGSPDSYLPLSHTCFFKIDLPAYTTASALAEKLRYAIENCGAIDTDFAASGSMDDGAASVASLDDDDDDDHGDDDTVYSDEDYDDDDVF